VTHETSGVKYSCEDCRKQFISVQNLQRHMEVIHKEAKYEHDTFKRAFVRKDVLERHRRE
jgi:hypothetical protein